jgi:hypothetical protein
MNRCARKRAEYLHARARRVNDDGIASANPRADPSELKAFGSSHDGIRKDWLDWEEQGGSSRHVL